jgi:hypothetical protein
MTFPPEVTAIVAGTAGLMVGAAFGIYYGRIIGESIGFEAAKWAYNFRLFGGNEPNIGAQAQNKPYNIGAAGAAGAAGVAAGVSVPIGAGGGSGSLSKTAPGTTTNIGGGGGSGVLIGGKQQEVISAAQQRAAKRLLAEELKMQMEYFKRDAKMQMDQAKKELETSRLMGLYKTGKLLNPNPKV